MAFESDGIVYAQDGNVIYARNGRSAEDQERFVADVRDEILPQLRAERQQLREKLDQILNEVDPVDLVVRASFLYLAIDFDTYREWESDRSPAHIEYLALQVLPLAHLDPRDIDPGEAWSLTEEAVHVVRQLFESEIQLAIFEQAEESGASQGQMEEYQSRTRVESMLVRGVAYPEHLRAVLLGTLGQIDDECERLLGFTAQQAMDITSTAVELAVERLEPKHRAIGDKQKELFRQLRRQRTKRISGPIPDRIVAMKPTEAKKTIVTGLLADTYAEARRIATVTPSELAEESGIPEPNVAAFLEAFSCPPSAYDVKHHRFPVGGHPLTEAPFLRVKNGYVLPVPSSAGETIRPRMEDLLQNADSKVWQRYVKRRADFVERETVQRLSVALPEASACVGLKWKSETDESDLDGLVAADDITLRIQCKAGRLHGPTRRGAPEKMRKDLEKLIKDAARQHAALDAALRQYGAVKIGLRAAQGALEKAPIQVEVIVCLDDVTVWSTRSHELQGIDILPSDRPTPWILSLTDLMAVTDLLQGVHLLHYITRRLRLEALESVIAHDELDWVGNYIRDGLYFDDAFDGTVRRGVVRQFRLLSYTEEIDSWYATREGLRTVPVPKPQQRVPPHVEAVIQQLEHERPAHWVIAGMALLMGDGDSRQTWEDALVHANERLLTDGWSSASQVMLNPSVGVTFYMDYRATLKYFDMMLARFVDQKIGEQSAENWIAIGVTRGGIRRVAIRSAYRGGIADVFFLPAPHDI